MDQDKIGKFIRKMRKEKGITQSDLAEMLGITDRAISKWENGICMPDAGTIPELCKILSITINDLFSGEMVEKKEYEKRANENLLKLKKQKEESDKQMLKLEFVIGYTTSISFLIMIFVASFIEMPNIVRILLIVFGLIIFVIGIAHAIKIEQIAGYYECSNCHYKYVPTYSKVLFSMHFGRTRYMKCPKCDKKSWSKKVYTK